MTGSLVTCQGGHKLTAVVCLEEHKNLNGISHKKGQIKEDVRKSNYKRVQTSNLSLYSRAFENMSFDIDFFPKQPVCH